MRYLIAGTLLLFLTISGCKNKQAIPDDILHPEKIQEVMWDVLTAESLARQLTYKDSTLILSDQIKKLTEEVYKSHHLTEEDFFRNYNWYAEHPTIFGPLMDSLYAEKSRINEDGRLMGDSAREKKADGRKESIRIKKSGEKNQ